MFLGLFAEPYVVPYDCDMLQKLLHIEKYKPKNRLETEDLFTFTEEILNKSLHFCAVRSTRDSLK